MSDREHLFGKAKKSTHRKKRVFKPLSAETRRLRAEVGEARDLLSESKISEDNLQNEVRTLKESVEKLIRQGRELKAENRKLQADVIIAQSERRLTCLRLAYVRNSLRTFSNKLEACRNLFDNVDDDVVEQMTKLDLMNMMTRKLSELEDSISFIKYGEVQEDSI